MRTIDKLKLTQLSKEELEKRQMDALRGGTPTDPTCVCNCYNSNTLSATQSANAKYGYQYSYGGDGSNTGYTTCTCTADWGPMVNSRGAG